MGYIIEALLEVTLTHTHLFHSHLENLQRLPTDTVLEQVGVGREIEGDRERKKYNSSQLFSVIKDKLCVCV